MSKRANVAASIESSKVDLSLENLNYSERMENSNPILDSQREWNKNFKKINTPSAITSLIDDMKLKVSTKQEALINGYLKKQVRKLKLQATANPNFMKTKSGVYYRLDEYEYIEELSVKDIDEAGNYTMESELANSKNILVATYDVNNKLIAIKLVNTEHEVYKSERYVAAKLGMKKEYAKPYKLHGYSGNSSGFIANIQNWLSSPISTGCYLYKGYGFYKWSMKNSQFVINLREGMKPGSPLMSDYEINDDIVLRTDYDGEGAIL